MTAFLVVTQESPLGQGSTGIPALRTRTLPVAGFPPGPLKVAEPVPPPELCASYSRATKASNWSTPVPSLCSGTSAVRWG